MFKQSILFLCGLLIYASANAEYPELAALKYYAQKKLAAYSMKLSSVDPKFQGVVAFGKSLDDSKSDGNRLKTILLSVDYWRSVMEMNGKDPTILFATAYIYIAQGQISLGERYLFLASLTMEDSYRQEIEEYQMLSNQLQTRVKEDMEKGIALNDKKEFAQAINIYDGVIKGFPSCDWAWYEKGLTHLLIKMDSESSLKLTNKDESIPIFAKCRELNPFFYQAYQGSDKMVIARMLPVVNARSFLDGKIKGIEGLNKFASGCKNAGIYDFAAHAEWKLILLDDPSKQKEHLKSFFDDLEFLNVENLQFLKSQFKQIN